MRHYEVSRTSPGIRRQSEMSIYILAIGDSLHSQIMASKVSSAENLDFFSSPNVLHCTLGHHDLRLTSEDVGYI
jgi:hypothetical protein